MNALLLMLATMLLVMPVDDFSATYRAVCMAESEGDPGAFRTSERAAGIAQIRPIYVTDCNRICALIGDPRRWTLRDCYDPAASYQMYTIYTVYWGCRYCRLTGKSPGPQQWARIHNGGHNGWKKQSTVAYWRKVQRRMP